MLKSVDSGNEKNTILDTHKRAKHNMNLIKPEYQTYLIFLLLLCIGKKIYRL